MGIRGLTTFIQNRSHLYLEEYELHSTNIVIDGYAIACQLYKWHCKSNDCFGGDYDKYAAVIENFFQILFQCKIIPYVIFDGGYENRKVATVLSRMKNKIKSAEQLSCVTEGSISVFPLFLRETFLDVVLKLKIKCVRCDFESDTEIANIARTLNCPVLSYDSDFFIFDVLYIPFSTFEMCTRKKKKMQYNESFTYVRCKIYRVDNFLKSFGGLDKRSLPILAVLLGNDYVKRSVFSMFYRHLKMQKCHGNQTEQQKRIKSLIIWLQNESVESAIQKVLSRYKCRRRRLIANKIRNAIKGYNCTNSMYLQYLEIAPVCPKETVNLVTNIAFADSGSEDSEDDDDTDDLEDSANTSDTEEETSISESDADLNFDKDELSLDAPTIFLEKFRKCLYPSSFMDILTRNKYYCIPQVEDNASEYSHAVSSEILQAIHKTLSDSKDNLVCVARGRKGNVRRYILPYCDTDMPSLKEIQDINIIARERFFLQVLKITEHFTENCVNLFPQSWHLFIITIKYLIDRSIISWPIVYALIVCKIFLGYVDKHAGLCRSQKAFEKLLSKHPINNKEVNNSLKFTINDALENINYNDSLICLKSCLPYFHMDLKMKISDRQYDRNILHSMAQFQSCILHVKYLNSLLNLPFANCIISEMFNGTLVYNLSVNFMKRSNLDSYITLLLQDAPTVLNSVKLILEEIKKYGSTVKPVIAQKKRKKKKKQHKGEDVTVTSNEQLSSEEDATFDPNNKYSFLIFSEKNC